MRPDVPESIESNIVPSFKNWSENRATAARHDYTVSILKQSNDRITLECFACENRLSIDRDFLPESSNTLFAVVFRCIRLLYIV